MTKPCLFLWLINIVMICNSLQKVVFTWKPRYSAISFNVLLQDLIPNAIKSSCP